MEAPKYPRIVVSASRHLKLGRQARKEGITLTELAEKIFKKAAK